MGKIDVRSVLIRVKRTCNPAISKRRGAARTPSAHSDSTSCAAYKRKEMTSIQLHSHLSYADRNAFMDSRRKVLACHHPDCTEQEPWADVKTAVLHGWGFEDRVSNGSVVRHWFCPAHKPVDDTPPLKAHIDYRRPVFGAELSPEAAKLAFGGKRLIVVRLGETAGTQLAVVIKEDAKGTHVTGWKAASRRWTGSKLVPPERIMGAPSPRDKRVLDAAREWPPEFLRPRSKGKRR
jgi:hypothetical protein